MVEKSLSCAGLPAGRESPPGSSSYTSMDGPTLPSFNCEVPQLPGTAPPPSLSTWNFWRNANHVVGWIDEYDMYGKYAERWQSRYQQYHDAQQYQEPSCSTLIGENTNTCQEQKLINMWIVKLHRRECERKQKQNWTKVETQMLSVHRDYVISDDSSDNSNGSSSSQQSNWSSPKSGSPVSIGGMLGLRKD